MRTFDARKELRGMTDNRFGGGGEYSIAKCHNCALLQTIPVPDPERFKQLYETYYNFGGEKETIYTKFRDVFLSSIVYRSWMAIDGDVSFHLRRGKGRLLDIGCNEGRWLQNHYINDYTYLKANQKM